MRSKCWMENQFTILQFSRRFLRLFNCVLGSTSVQFSTKDADLVHHRCQSLLACPRVPSVFSVFLIYFGFQKCSLLYPLSNLCPLHAAWGTLEYLLWVSPKTLKEIPNVNTEMELVKEVINLLLASAEGELREDLENYQEKLTELFLKLKQQQE